MLLLAPATILFSIFVVGLALFAGLWFTGQIAASRAAKHNELFGPFFGQFLVWILRPLEWLFVGRVSANTITAASLFFCIASGVSAGIGHFAAAAWMFAIAGLLDAIDGRIARLNGEQTQAGALYDSVADRWGELVVGAGFAWYLRDTPWMLAAMAATSGSMMVSYTRARAEGLGIELRGGMMQRAERVTLISFGSFIAAGFEVAGMPSYVVPTVGGTMLLCGMTSIGTALSRWLMAYRELAKREDKKKAKAAVANAAAIAALNDESSPMFPVPAKMRESAEMGL